MFHFPDSNSGATELFQWLLIHFLVWSRAFFCTAELNIYCISFLFRILLLCYLTFLSSQFYWLLVHCAAPSVSVVNVYKQTWPWLLFWVVTGIALYDLQNKNTNLFSLWIYSLSKNKLKLNIHPSLLQKKYNANISTDKCSTPLWSSDRVQLYTHKWS